jgi:hypothetical protein
MLFLAEKGYLVFRNNTGAFQTVNGFVKFGLCVGSSDLIGLTPEGRFFAIECKTKTGRATDEQKKFIEAIKKSNGIAGICRSIDDVTSLLDLDL